MFAELGARLIDADAIAHDLMRPGKPVYQAIVRHFGSGVVNQDRTINRARLAHEAFSNRRIEELNRLVHPSVLARQEEWMDEIEREDPSAISVVEAALILEAGAASQFDKLVVVTCLPEQKAERFGHRQGLNSPAAQAEVDRRQAAQWPDSEKIARADYVIDNSGPLEKTRLQVAGIFRELKMLATA